MNSQQWERAEELFSRGLDAPPAHRASILQECADDPEIQSELERLWHHAEAAGSFLREPVLPRSFSVGTLVAGRFRIVDFAGAGGMGEVYQARDERLGRLVALKVLPPRLAANDVYRRRLEEEARAVSALQDPRICAIYDLVGDGPWVFMVMEFVPGETLEQRLQRGPLPENEAVRIAVRICEALQHAHDRGLVHRDLKPANILLGDAGVKLLDFGIASWGDAAGNDVPIAGSPSYMSPEQAAGEVVGRRSDIFSLGVVVWEMLTARRAFPEGPLGTTAPPAVRTVNPAVSAGLQQVIGRCLAASPARRYSSAAELANALENRRPYWPPAAAGLAAVAVLLGAAAWLALRPVPAGEPKLVPLTALAGVEFAPALSPDGRRVAFLWTGANDNGVGLYVKPVGSGEPRKLSLHPDSAHSPYWSPDGRWIAFSRAGDLLLISPDPPVVERRLATMAPETGRGCDIHLSWTADSHEILFTGTVPNGGAPSLHAVSVASGAVRRIHTAPAAGGGDWCASVSPNGKRLLWRRSPQDASRPVLMVGDLKEGLRIQHERALPWIHAVTWNWANGTEILFSKGTPAGSFLFRASVDREEEPRQLPFGEEGLYPTVAPAARRLAYMHREWDVDLWRMSLASGSAPERFLASTRNENAAEYSPSGTHLAFLSQRGGTAALWVANQDGTEPRPLASVDNEMYPPRWLADGRSLVYSHQGDIWTVGLDGQPARRLIGDAANDTGPSVSADGKWLYFTSDRSGQPEVWRAPLAGGAAATRLTRAGGFAPLVSQDGELLFFLRIEGARNVLYVQPLAGGTAAAVAETIPRRVNLARRPEGIYFLTGAGWDAPARLCLYDTKRRSVREVLTLPRKQRWTATGLSLTPDGRIAVFAGSRMDGDLMLVENFK